MALASGSAAVLLAAAAVQAPVPADPFPQAASSYVVSVDGRTVWSGNAEEARPPASLAKIMTALVLLEGDWKEDAMVAVSAAAASAPGSRMGLRKGDRLRAGDLLTAMLVRSANDAAEALAEHAAGSEEAFVKRMNLRATELGLARTRFVNPTGLDADGQMSSAADLLRLTEVALVHEDFASRVAMEHATVASVGGRRFSLDSSNVLLGRLDGVRGVKTGFTSRAGKCVVALAERNGCRVLAVLLDAPDRWWAAAAMIEKAFESCDAPSSPPS
jgi:D-alanyl-D-alanine carboxypeptidase (penicillin-binding protein 5/6)